MSCLPVAVTGMLWGEREREKRETETGLDWTGSP